MIEGSFRDVSLPALLQLLCIDANKSYRIRVTADNQKGYILVRRGTVIAAKFGILEGEDAICEFLCWDDGAFLAEQVVAQTDVEKNLRVDLKPSARFIEDSAVLVEHKVGLNSQITGSQLFGSPEWKALVQEHPLDRECFSVLAWLREGRKMHQALREFGLDIVRATEILSSLIRTQSIQVIRPGASHPLNLESPRVEYSLVSTTGGQQEAAANLAKEAARALESADVGDASFVSTSYKPAAVEKRAEATSTELQTQSGEYTQVRSSMEARLRAKKNSATGSNIPAFNPDRAASASASSASASVEAHRQGVGATAKLESEAPKVSRPDLSTVLQNQPNRIIDLGESKTSDGKATSSTHDVASVRQANLKEGRTGHSSARKNGDSGGDSAAEFTEPIPEPIAAKNNQTVLDSADKTIIIRKADPSAGDRESFDTKPVRAGSVKDSNSSSPFAKLTKSITDPARLAAANASSAPTPTPTKNAVTTTSAPPTPEPSLSEVATSLPASEPLTINEGLPSIAPTHSQAQAAADSVNAIGKAPVVTPSNPASEEASTQSDSRNVIFEKSTAEGRDPKPISVDQSKPSDPTGAPSEPDPPATQPKSDTGAPRLPVQPAKPPVAQPSEGADSQRNDSAPLTELIAADDRRFVAKTQAMPLVAFDIERLLLTSFLATQFGKLALGNPSLDPHRRQTLLDAEFGKTLSASIEEGNRPPAAVLSSYRYCLDRGYIETHDPVIPLTADLLLGRMEIDQYLLQRRRLTGDELRDLMKVAREEGIKLIQVLVKAGYLTEADLETLGREQKRFSFK